jgi:hypothetical protein
VDEIKWENLLHKIKSQKCTPFIGAGACKGTIPLGAEIAKSWSEEYKYPLRDMDNLTKVAQFLAWRGGDGSFPKTKIVNLIKDCRYDPKKEHNNHKIMAHLPFPVYITTNYDSLMQEALENENKQPQWRVSKWNNQIQAQEEYQNPTDRKPLVFHLHGHLSDHNSMVLTEDDYLDFLVNIKEEQVLPARIQEAISGSSLLFIGYSLNDWTFKVLFRGIINTLEQALRPMHIAVQLKNKEDNAEQYLAEYFRGAKINVYWGTAEEFLQELSERWNKFNGK